MDNGTAVSFVQRCPSADRLKMLTEIATGKALNIIAFCLITYMPCRVGVSAFTWCHSWRSSWGMHVSFSMDSFLMNLQANVLIDREQIAKISDFGLSKVMEEVCYVYHAYLLSSQSLSPVVWRGYDNLTRI